LVSVSGALDKVSHVQLPPRISRSCNSSTNCIPSEQTASRRTTSTTTTMMPVKREPSIPPAPSSPHPVLELALVHRILLPSILSVGQQHPAHHPEGLSQNRNALAPLPATAGRAPGRTVPAAARNPPGGSAHSRNRKQLRGLLQRHVISPAVRL
jgi:hypothetical protein